MKILFLNPPHLMGSVYMKEVGRCGRKSIAGEYWPPTGLASLAAVAGESGAQPLFWDGMLPHLHFENLKLYLLNHKPSVIIMLTTTPTFNNDLQNARLIKEYLPESLIGMVGTHSSVYTEETCKSEEIDFVLINEAENTLSFLVPIWKDFFKSWRSKAKDIPALAFKQDDGSIHVNHTPSYVTNLDNLPFPERCLMRLERYTMPFFNNEPFVTIIPSRGCPYRCTFCRAGRVWGSKVRLRSVENVIREIELITQRYEIKNLVFMTDSFTFSRQWVMDFCKALKELATPLRWICNSRVDAVDLPMLQAMKESGCLMVSYGIESPHPDILKSARKDITSEDIRKAIKVTRKAGILSFGYFILGLPGETEQTIKKTIRFARKLRPDFVNFHIATPFPGTEFYQYARNHSLLTTRKWEAFEEEGSAVISYPHLPAERLQFWQKKAMKAFYLRPQKILREILRLRSLSEFKAKCKAFRKIFFSS